MKEFGTSQERMIDRGIFLERMIKANKKELDSIKAVLQSEALRRMEDTNTKYVEYFGKDGSVTISYKEKFEVDNGALLEELIGKFLFDTKVKIEHYVKLNVDDKLKKALMAIYKGNFQEHDLKQMLVGMGLDEKQTKLALKKLKGDYFKDRALLEGFGLSGGFEEELDAVKEHRNFELVGKFFDDIDAIRRDVLHRAIDVDESIAIGFNYADEDEDGEEDESDTRESN